jgi:hypothetical protein
MENVQPNKTRYGFSIILNFILLGFLIFYLLHPSWVLKQRYYGISLFKQIASGVQTK